MSVEPKQKRWIHGRAVQDGKVRFLSVSSLEKGDSSKPTGCLRRWHYQYIGGIKEAPSDAMERGTRLHGEIAHYLTTGEQVLSSQVLAGMHMIPEPGDDLLVEHDIVPEMPNGKSGIEIAPLRAAGIPLVGAIDLIHQRGTNKGTEAIEEMYDPKGTIEVIDWKTCRTLNNIKKGAELLKSIQMAGYGKYIFETNPESELVRLSHGYFPQQGVPRKTTIRVDRNQIDKSWEHANRVASSIGDAAKEPNPDKVEANTDACNAYGKECPARSVCTAVKSNALSMFVGNELAEQLIPSGNLIKNMTATNTSGSVFAQIRAKASNIPEPRANRSIFGQVEKKEAEETVSPLVVSSSPGEAVTGSDVDRMKAEIARLEAQERLAKGPELLPPDAPQSDPLRASKPKATNIFTQAMSEVVSEMVTDVPAPKKRGRKPKVEPVIVPEPPTPEPAREPSNDDIDPIAIPVSPVNFYIDCAPDSGSESLWPLVDRLVRIMCEEAAVSDIRLSEDKRFAFGRWKGLLADGIHKTVEGGDYTLLHAQGDIALVVVETMRQITRATGGKLVMGAR